VTNIIVTITVELATKAGTPIPHVKCFYDIIVLKDKSNNAMALHVVFAELTLAFGLRINIIIKLILR